MHNTPPPPSEAPFEGPALFPDVLAAERADIAARRQKVGLPPDAPLCGLALSGGGIRSATFCLGILQAMHRHGLLRIFDYLSTVSGGGFVGSWWSAWLSRQPRAHLFPGPEDIEPGRCRPERGYESDSAQAAGRDPVHHLRLFANYLTPRKGLLSGDTWRAAAVVSRNLILTWLILLPMLLAGIVAARLYFVWDPPLMTESGSFLDPLYQAHGELRAAYAAPTPTSDVERPAHEQRLHEARRQYLRCLGMRALFAAAPLAVLLALIVTVTVVWLLDHSNKEGRTDWALAGGALVVFALLVVLVTAFCIFAGRWPEAVAQAAKSPGTPWLMMPRGLAVLVLSYGVLLVGLAIYEATSWWGQGQGPGYWRSEVRRNRLVRLHGRLLLALCALAAALAVAGLVYESLAYLWYTQAKPYLKAGGVSAVFAAAAGALFTGLKAAPTGGGDESTPAAPGLPTRIIFALTPVLVLLVLALAAAAGAHWFTIFISTQMERGAKTGAVAPPLYWLTAAGAAGMLLGIFYAGVELRWRTGPEQRFHHSRRSTTLLLLGLAITLTVAGIALLPELAPARPTPRHSASLVVVMLLTLTLLLWRLKLTRDFSRDRARQGPQAALARLQSRKQAGLFRFAWLTLAACVLACIVAAGIPAVRFAHPSGTPRIESLLAATPWLGSVLCALVLAFEARWGRGSNERCIWLLLAAWTLLAAWVLTALANGWLTAAGVQGRTIAAFTIHRPVALSFALIDLIGVSMAWVIAFGWAVDPNALSLHAFYKARLTRAYLGASNPRRGDSNHEVSEAVMGDDLCLHELRNSESGAPYHLINTTLNLVSGRDLATAQRHSACYVLSRLYCGSERTGYRRTSEYMNGRLSLGTAAAVSGAAASPNMGARQVTSAQAMLLTLLNVRLGFWAPTPNRHRWRTALARLWPFYTLREFLSQTNDLSSYCYLTDGGHFDNTGLYSLIERGCRYIVVADCGADPGRTFADLGDAVRRCRIDFGAEITLDISPPETPGHFIVGEIRYRADHLRALLGTEPTPEQLLGAILWFKPAVAPGDPADVRQYRLAENVFPQQTTGDQWFDEAQFESYRRLGERSADAAFEPLPEISAFAADAPLTVEAIANLFEALGRPPAATSAEQPSRGDGLARQRPAGL